jgi:hypothetical protein
MGEGSSTGKNLGVEYILHSSFTGGPRYMVQNYHDGMAISRVHGAPDLFITFTCNPKWQEITNALSLEPGKSPSDRPDIVTRVFHMKYNEFLADVKNGHLFGPIKACEAFFMFFLFFLSAQCICQPVHGPLSCLWALFFLYVAFILFVCTGVFCTADLYVVEFQKRGLPHTHTLIWLKRNTQEPSSALIDGFISAELPDPEKDPLGYVLVDEFMVHGPCGDLNKKCPCMKEGICSKRFPKAYNDETLVDDKGFPVYRRRDDGRFVLRNKGTVKLTNKWVVPYNLNLLKRF